MTITINCFIWKRKGSFPNKLILTLINWPYQKYKATCVFEVNLIFPTCPQIGIKHSAGYHHCFKLYLKQSAGMQHWNEDFWSYNWWIADLINFLGTWNKTWVSTCHQSELQEFVEGHFLVTFSSWKNPRWKSQREVQGGSNKPGFARTFAASGASKLVKNAYF